MGEDRVTFGERKNGDVLPSRQRHSSVISSCSEESETTSTGYPLTPDEDKEEELEYGPGIVNKLRTRFLSISLKQNRGTIRRSCSMENLLDQDRPSRINIFSQNEFNGNSKETEEHNNTIWGNLKRAKSMDTLLMDLKQESSHIPMKTVNEVNGDVKKEPKIVRRRDGGLNRTGPTICDEELPKPDTVKTYKRMFEPAESRRGSYSRKPPVLRASAKSGTLSVSKINGVSPSAKVNGIVSKNKLSAKPSSPVKAQPDMERIISNNTSNQPLVNGDESKPQCNGNYVKATPVKIADISLCNGKSEKPLEKELNGFNMNKKNIQNNQKNSVVLSNGNPTLKELLKTETSENYIKPDVKKLVNLTYKAVNGSDKPLNGLNGLNQKPKVPPNRPTFIKNAKPGLRIGDVNGIDKKSPLIPKLKPTPFLKKPQDVVKPEISNNTLNKIEETVISESRISEDIVKESVENETKPQKADVNKIAEESTEKISEKIETKIVEEICVEKTDLAPMKEVEKETVNHVNEHTVDDEKLTNNQKVESVEIKPESKPIKKPQSSESNITTSMVFDFRGKDVVPHVAVLPVPFGCKALHPKKKSLLIDGKAVVNGLALEDEDEYHVDYSVPAPSGVVFEGENVKIGRGSILSVRNKDLKIKFDVNVNENTFVYPSETSLLEDNTDTSLSPSPPPNEVIPNGQPPPNKLKSSPAIGSSSAGGLSTYTPSVLRTMDNFEPGMFRPPPAITEKEDDKNVQSGEEENTEVREDCQEKQEMLKPADPGIISSWSLSAGTSDLLF